MEECFGRVCCGENGLPVLPVHTSESYKGVNEGAVRTGLEHSARK